MEINSFIDFPVDEKNQISDDLDKSLDRFKDEFLWRKSQKGEIDHFVLKKDEKEISLFLLKNNDKIDDNGLNFLIFFFCYPARKPFCESASWIRESIAISLSPKILRTKLTAGEALISKFSIIKISENQKYDNATHCELIFSKNEEGTFYDLDSEVLALLRESSQINPEKQEKDFMDRIFHNCINNLTRSIVDNICNNLNLGNYNSKTERGNISNDRKLLNKLKSNFDLSSDYLNSCLNLDSEWTLEQIMDLEFYPSIIG